MTRDWISEVIKDVAELDHASPEGFPEQMIVTAEELRVILERQGAERDALRKDADLWRYALKRGVVTVHSERIVDHDSGTRCSWIQGHYKSADIPNAALAKEQS